MAGRFNAPCGSSSLWESGVMDGGDDEGITPKTSMNWGYPPDKTETSIIDNFKS